MLISSLFTFLPLSKENAISWRVPFCLNVIRWDVVEVKGYVCSIGGTGRTFIRPFSVPFTRSTRFKNKTKQNESSTSWYHKCENVISLVTYQWQTTCPLFLLLKAVGDMAYAAEGKVMADTAKAENSPTFPSANCPEHVSTQQASDLMRLPAHCGKRKVRHDLTDNLYIKDHFVIMKLTIF